ncbi:MAG: hypothetical protein Q8M37_03990 [Nevskia sp.]|nr:hypothetical protein [Nevskia sp.]
MGYLVRFQEICMGLGVMWPSTKQSTRHSRQLENRFTRILSSKQQAASSKQIIFIFYPDKDEAEGSKNLRGLEAHSSEILAEGLVNNSNINIFSVARDPRWRSTFYRDKIHPTVDGTRVLAEIIAKPAESTALAK